MRAKLGIDEGHVEAGIVGDQAGAVDELQELVGDLVEGRLVGEIGRADAVYGQRVGMDRPALRIDVEVEDAAGRKAVDQFDAADLDDAVLARVQPGRFRVEDDFAHRISSFAEHGRAGRRLQAACAAAAPAFPR